MPKQLEITDRIERLMRAATGDESLDTSALAVFETTLVDTRPLNKRGSIFDQGRITRATLSEMAEHLSSGNTIPLHTLHRQGAELPVGRVFHAEVADMEDGHAELIGYFFLPNVRTELVSDINNSVLNSVSVGLKSKKMLCSECGWDYLGEDASFMHLWDRTCENDHTVGKDGVYVNMAGMDTWYETSLVSEGAARKAKIASRSAARLSQDQLEQLAADGHSVPEAVVLFAEFTEEKKVPNANKGGEQATAVIELVNLHAAAKADLALVQAKVTDLEAQIAALTAERDELKAASTDDALKASLEEAQAQVAQFDGVAEFLAEQCKAALIASGQENPEVPETIEAQMAAIKEAGVKLHQLFPEGGAAQAANSGEEAPDRPVNLDAFRVRK